jgi:hypothetical protein
MNIGLFCVFDIFFFFFFFPTMNRCSDPVPKQFKVRAPAGHTFQESLNSQRLSLLAEPFGRYTTQSIYPTDVR